MALFHNEWGFTPGDASPDDYSAVFDADTRCTGADRPNGCGSTHLWAVVHPLRGSAPTHVEVSGGTRLIRRTPTRPAAAPANPGWSSGQLSFGGLALVAGLLLAPLVGFRLGALGRFLLLALHPNDLDVGGRTLTRGPRGTDPDHPRLELLCRTAMTILRELPRDELLHTPAAAERVFDVWRDGADIARWLARHVGLASPPK